MCRAVATVAATTLAATLMHSGVAAAAPVPTAPARAAPAATPTAASPTATPVASTPLPTATPTPTSTPTLRAFTTVPRPVVSGAARFGSTLTAAAGTWKPAASVTFQWRVDGKSVAGATGRTWRVTAAAIGKRVTVAVTGTRSGYRKTVVASAATAPIVRATLRTATPKISGTPTVDKTLTAVPGTWGPAPVRTYYRWLRDGVSIPGATRSTYRATTADIGRTISVRIAVHKTGYTRQIRTIEGVRIGRALRTSAPVISGTVAVGRTLTATHTSWSPAGVRHNHQWYRGSSRIAGATATTYRLTAADAGKKVSVRIGGRKSGYTTAVRASAAVVVPRVLTVPASVSMSGSRTVGSTLTAAVGTWGPSPVTLSYQWYRDGRSIAGAKSKTYRLVDADATTEISVKVVGRKAGYTSVSRVSAPAEVKWAFSSTPTPKISGTAQAGQILKVTAGTWRDAPDSLTLQWRVDGGAVTGATRSTFEVPVWAAGRTITVTATAKRKDYVTVSRTSASTPVSWSLGSSIAPGTSLRSGVHLSSPDGAYRFGILGDGNLALTKGTTPVREAETTGLLDGLLQFRGDGALVLLDESDSIAWTGSAGGLGGTALSLSDDGVVRLTDGAGGTVWSSDQLRAFAEPTAARSSVPGRYGWAFPIRPNGTFTTYAGHSGDDIAAPRGTPIYAMRGGTVAVREIWITSGCPSWAPNKTRQKEVVITSTIDGRKFVQVYAHLDSFSVKTGQKVTAGQKIGAVGSTGCSTGPHLHTAFTVDGVRYALYPRDVLGVTSY